jgi:Carboxypeptidase regulatory-like domain
MIRNRKSAFSVFFVTSFLCCCMQLVLSAPLRAQQTLGGITGTVSDGSGAILPNTTVSLVNDQTKLSRTQSTNEGGTYDFVNLPIGSYTLTFTHDGFETQKIPSIVVQADRTATLNATLKIGQVGTTVTVEASPLMNAVDTTNGYILEKDQIESVPLPTGSFTGIAILSPGVNAELSGGTGVNNGLGNQPIWANGQRDTSNTFMMNGVDASNLFNGKSTSSVASARIVNNTGIGGAASLSSTTAEPIQSTASPYLAIGQALPTPAPESIQEFRVNTSMYDAQQGSTSGAHIDLSTASGTNNMHGSAYVHRGTDALNAAPYFYNADPNIPANDKVPELHRYTAGGTFGAPIIKDKLFGYVSFQHTHDSDQEIGSSRVAVPPGLTDSIRNNPAALAALVNGNFPDATTTNATVGTDPGDINPIAYGLLNYKLANGQYLIPSASTNPAVNPISINFPENAFTIGTSYFIADQGVADLDWNVNAKDTLALKYYYQHDPSIAPYAYSGSPGFTQHLDAGSQVASITNTQTITPRLSIAEVFGFIREKVYSTIDQPFTPQQFSSYVQTLLPGLSAAQTSINTFGSTFFPGLSIVDNYGNEAPYNTSFVPNAGMNIGDGANSQGAFTGVFQNRFMPSANAIWVHGKHTVTFGGSFAYTQLNTRDERTNKGTIAFADFSQFLQGLETSYSPNGFVTTAFLQGDANRYFRSRDIGAYIQDKFQWRSNLSITFGLRLDDHGGLTEKFGRLYNFEPSLYNYDAGSDTIVSNGLIIAGNDKQFPTKGVSNSTLTGRQWGLAPRLGVAWSPEMFHNKIVVRAGWGMYYDRGELFSYLSPGVAAGVIPGGPFGVNQTPPFVNSQVCSAISTFYEFFIPTCDPTQANGGSFNNPWGATLQGPPTGNPATISLPNAAAIEEGSSLFAFADYNRKNKLPYTFNEILDIQWQPRKDLLIEVGYVGNLGRHEIIPIPFNQAGIASPTHPIHGQNYTYGYTVQSPSCFTSVVACAIFLPDGSQMQATYEGGNVDLRVPFIGYSSESESYTAAGISAYNALQAHVEKRLSHGLQVGGSYTFSHSTDEQSGMGLFYNGSNPSNLRSGYGLSDFDRKHVLNFTYLYQLPKFFEPTSMKGRFADGWAIEGLAIIQSGQPYSVVDYSGAVGSIFFGTSDGITNPVVPLSSSCTASQALTGANGATFGAPALKADCFTLPLLSPGDLGGAIPAGDTFETNFASGERNIFRQSWQKRTDLSVVKLTQLTERFALKFSFDIFNLTNTASFDVPIDNVSQNLFFNDFPVQGQPLYSSPTLGGLGIVNKTIGSPRQIQMTLRLTF